LHVESLADTAREWAENARLLARLGRALPGFLRRPLGPEDARSRLLGHLATREQRFFVQLDDAVYGYARSPYRRLLALAGCERGDVARLVAQEGLDGALRVLADRGVYVTFDEFKGRRAAERGSASLWFTERDFDNPRARSHYLEFTGGTRGRPSRVGRALGSVTDTAVSFTAVLAAHGIERPRNLFWIGGSPSWLLVHFHLGHTVDAWYYPIDPLPPLVRAGLGCMRGLAHVAGHRMPPLVHADLREPEPIVRWLVARAEPDRPVIVNTVVSSAVRIASVATDLGVSLAGVTFNCRSEMLSGPRRRVIEAAGAQALANYATVEVSSIAYGCPHGSAPDDLHLCLERYAVIERERPVFAGGPLVDALLFTTLSESAPKIALNLETGDSARIEQRACGCLLGDLGLTTHLSEVRSFEKLSSEGTTFARTNVAQILEELLPARFGGTALDYQLVEVEGAAAASRLLLRVHPCVGPLDEASVRAAFLTELGRGGMVDTYQARLIEQARSVEVERLPPLATGGGKVLPYHLAREAQPTTRG